MIPVYRRYRAAGMSEDEAAAAIVRAIDRTEAAARSG